MLQVRRNDALSAAEAVALKPSHIVLSPGPCGPDQAGICLDLIKAAADGENPAARRMSRTAMHRAGFRRHDRPRADADAWQGRPDYP